MWQRKTFAEEILSYLKNTLYLFFLIAEICLFHFELFLCYIHTGHFQVNSMKKKLFRFIVLYIYLLFSWKFFLLFSSSLALQNRWSKFKNSFKQNHRSDLVKSLPPAAMFKKDWCLSCLLCSDIFALRCIDRYFSFQNYIFIDIFLFSFELRSVFSE